MPFLKTVKLYEVMGTPIYLPTLLVGCLRTVYVIYLNFKAATSAARLQGFLTKLLLGGMGLTILPVLHQGLAVAHHAGVHAHRECQQSVDGRSPRFW